jgi:hypothetical protein
VWSSLYNNPDHIAFVLGPDLALFRDLFLLAVMLAFVPVVACAPAVLLFKPACAFLRRAPTLARYFVHWQLTRVLLAPPARWALAYGAQKRCALERVLWGGG